MSKPTVLSYGVTAVLAADLTTAATSFTVEGGGSGFPTLDFQVEIGDEIIFVASRSGNTFSSLTRGDEGTAAAPHNRGDAVAEIAGPLAVEDRIELTDRYDGTGHSHQSQSADLDLSDNANAGKSTAGDTAFIGAGMWNIIGAALAKTKNYLFGACGAFSVTGAKAGELPAGALLGIVMDGVTDVDGAVVAAIDGDDPSAVTRVGAMFKARIVNNNAGSGADYGLDLYDAGVSSAILTDGGVALAYSKAELRLSHEVCLILNAGAPTNGTTGANVAGKGSLLIDYTNGKLYLNTNTKASPTWTVVGTQS